MFFYTSVNNRGKFIYFRGYKDGKRVTQKIEFKPTLYVKSPNKNSDYRSLFGECLEPIKFEDCYEARDFIKRYKDVSNFQIFGNYNFNYQFISKLFKEDVKFDTSQIKIYTLDIETSTEYGFPNPMQAQEEVLLISCQDFGSKQITTFGCKPFVNTKANVKYVLCNNESDLLRKFIDFLKESYPDIITGWNCQLFDIAYLSNRIMKVLGEKALDECSPHGIVSSKEINFNTGDKEMVFDWVGISILDYMDLYKKFSFKVQESYKLDHIAQEELGKEKIKSKYATFKEFYTNDWQLFVEYNIVDVELVDQLEDNMKLLVLIMTMAYDAKCNFMDIFSAVRTWDCIIYNALLKKNIILSNPKTFGSKDKPIIGAYVKQPTPGKYDWVVSFDATSLYPSIIMSFNMSPETLVDGAKYLADTEESIQKLIDKEVDMTEVMDKDYIMTANGQCFSRNKKGIFPELIEHYFSLRQKSKKQMFQAQKKYDETKDEQYQKDITRYNCMQMAAKILMNSLYGATSNVYFRYYDTRVAEGITMTGQYIIKSVSEELNKYLNRVSGTKEVDYSFYCDTDSAYFTLENWVKKNHTGKSKQELVDVVDQYCIKNIEPTINKACTDIFKYLNGYADNIKFKREVIADRGIWIAKKRYALNVHNSEGIAYNPPKLKVLGLEIVRSSTPAFVRKALKDSIVIALTGEEQQIKDYVDEVNTKWVEMETEEISFPRSVNGMTQYGDPATIFKKGTPIQTRGALLYNHLIKKYKLDKKYQYIKDGDKIKFLYLKEPNPLNSHVIGFFGSLPEEFKLNKYIDYDKMLEKTFSEPLKSILDVIGWKMKEEATLEGLFG